MKLPAEALPCGHFSLAIPKDDAKRKAALPCFTD